MLGASPGSDDNVADALGAVLLRDFGLALRINVFKLEMRAQAFIFRHQVVELRISLFRKSDHDDVFLQPADDLLRLVGERKELFGSEVETLVVAISDEIREAQNDENGEAENQRVGAKFR